MGEWLHNLPLAWMALVVFGVAYLVTWGIYRVVTTLAVDERARAFKGISPGMLPRSASFSDCSSRFSHPRPGAISTRPTPQ
jgi:hypothetical protein